MDADQLQMEVERLKERTQKFAVALGECVLERTELKMENRRLREELINIKNQNHGGSL